MIPHSLNKLSTISIEDLKEKLDYLKVYLKKVYLHLVKSFSKIKMKSKKLEIAFKMYLEEKVSIGKATKLAGLSIWEMIDRLHDKNVSLEYKLSKAKEEIENILKRFKEN